MAKVQHWWIEYHVLDPDQGDDADSIERRVELFEFDTDVEDADPLPNGVQVGYGPTSAEILAKLRRHIGHDGVVVLRCRHVDDPDAPTAPEVTKLTDKED
ncbi:hypothetical protein AB0I22_37105 [Streptomyces sp. NPDC050610]|uniref:hypothetical protein n=1 Tax=Streptomyces sp. NPDC050610 TaxID=3157097 RepID=UPI00342C07F3